MDATEQKVAENPVGGEIKVFHAPPITEKMNKTNKQTNKKGLHLSNVPPQETEKLENTNILRVPR